MKRLGTLIIALGVLLLAGALVVYMRAQIRAQEAGQASAVVYAQLMEQTREEETTLPPDPEAGTEPPAPFDPTMTEVILGYNAYVGYLTLPTLDLPLPIMSTWSYEKLNVSPCRFHGSTKTDDLVLIAHNFPLHFGTLDQLKVGDEILFTDMDDLVHTYQVAATEILQPDAVDDLLSGEYDLTLVTCTYGGASRVTVRCDRALEP